MSGATNVNVEVSPLHGDGALRGFMVSGRWPASTREWTQFLVLAVRIAGVPGLLPPRTVVGVHEDAPGGRAGPGAGPVGPACWPPNPPPAPPRLPPAPETPPGPPGGGCSMSGAGGW